MSELEKRWISSEDLFTAVAEALQEGQSASFTVTGMSMWPLMCHGRDKVIVASVESEQLQAGDIVLFRAAPDHFMLHRITKIRDGQFESTGDGNCFRDGWFPEDAVIAKVKSVIRPKRTIHCDRRIWRLYGRIWMWLYPVRKPMFAAWRRIRK